MLKKWKCESAEANNGIKRVLITHDGGSPGQPSNIHVNATSEVVPETFMVGDVWGVTFTLIYRPGQNGPRK